MVERKGVEPSTSCVQGRRSSQMSYPPKKNGEEDRIRTCDHLVPNQVLYQAELLLQKFGLFINFYIFAKFALILWNYKQIIWKKLKKYKK